MKTLTKIQIVLTAFVVVAFVVGTPFLVAQPNLITVMRRSALVGHFDIS